MSIKLWQLHLITAGLSVASVACAASRAAQTSRDPQISGSPTTVVVDAGHGGFDRGGIPSQRIPEKEMTLDVAQRLKTLLAASGYNVVMTRDSDVFVPLPSRVAIANSYRNAIFVCIHFNSANRIGAGGIETYFYGRDSLPLASAIHYYVAGGAPSSNRGVRRRGFYVLRKTTVPAVLVECGFLTNPTEGEYVPIDKNWRKRSRREFARGILWLRRARREWQRQIVFRCNRISIRLRQVTPSVPGPAIRGKKGPEAARQKRKAHPKRLDRKPT